MKIPVATLKKVRMLNQMISFESSDLSFFLRITICGVSRFKPSSRCCKENQGQTPPPGLLPRSVAAVVVVSGSVGYGSSGNNVFEGFDGNQKSGKLRRLAIFLPLFTGFP